MRAVNNSVFPGKWWEQVKVVTANSQNNGWISIVWTDDEGQQTDNTIFCGKDDQQILLRKLRDSIDAVLNNKEEK